jgi:phosphoserine phosphatase
MVDTAPATIRATMASLCWLRAGILRVDVRGKDLALRHIADRIGCPLHWTASVGDSAFDLPMLRASGLGIGYGCTMSLKTHSEFKGAWANTLGDVLRIVREFEKLGLR